MQNLDTALMTAFVSTAVENAYTQILQHPLNENTYIQYVENNNLEAIAKDIVDAWVSSESHRMAISKDWYDSTTVSTIIRYNKKTGYFKLAAAWHEEDDLWENAFKN